MTVHSGTRPAGAALGPGRTPPRGDLRGLHPSRSGRGGRCPRTACSGRMPVGSASRTASSSSGPSTGAPACGARCWPGTRRTASWSPGTPGRRRTTRPRWRCASRHPTAVARGSSSSTAAGNGSGTARCVADTATSGPAPGGTCSTTSPTSPTLARMPSTSTAVAAAYDAFFAEAERGGFGEPPPGEWDAARVLAHVALNDLAMTAVAHALVQGRTDLTFGNTTCQDPQVLTDWVAATGDLSALVARGRRLARGVDGRHRPARPRAARPRRCRAGCSTTASWCSTPRCRGDAWPPTPRRACTCRRTPASCATCGG